MIPTWLLPATMMALSIGSSIVYAFSGDLRQTVYWAAAAVITASVTF